MHSIIVINALSIKEVSMQAEKVFSFHKLIIILFFAKKFFSYLLSSFACLFSASIKINRIKLCPIG